MQKYNFSHLITFAKCAEMLGYSFANLHYYKKAGRFIKPSFNIAGKEYYDSKEVEKWQPDEVKKGRPKK